MTAPQTYVQTPAAKAAYDVRWQRIMDCVNLKQPDRMPTTMMATFWLAKYGGVSYRQLMVGPWKRSTSSNCSGQGMACATTSPINISIANT
jgi:hypothetical protein